MPELVEIKITRMVLTHRYGDLSAGTILRTDKDFADHLVKDCQAAEYIVRAEQTQKSDKKTKKKD